MRLRGIFEYFAEHKPLSAIALSAYGVKIDLQSALSGTSANSVHQGQGCELKA